MKNTGIVRKIDELGRVTLPIELRRNLGIEEKDPIEIFVESGAIILKKHEETAETSKNTGIVRKIDELGRVTLPIEIRRMLDIEEKDPIEIHVDDTLLFLKKYYASCIFCGNLEENVLYLGKYVCKKCRTALKKL